METEENDTNFNVYAGSDCGVLKGIYFGAEAEAPRLKNFHAFSTEGIERKTEIVSMSWDSEENEKELFVGFSNNTVKIYNTKLKAFTQANSLSFDQEQHGRLVSLYSYNNSNFVFGTNKGSLMLWNHIKNKSELEISTGSNLARLRRCVADNNIFATGGKETELQLWNLASPTPEIPTFKSKNVPHDFLDLRVPVWVQDMTFLPESNDVLAICSRYGHVRLYDTRANNRPTVNMQYLDHPLIAISTASSNSRHVLVGSARGVLGLVDLRKVDGSLVRQYRGHAGGVTSICAHPSLPFFTSCGLDRHLYVHHINEKKARKRLYLKSRLHAVIMCKNFDFVEGELGETQDSEKGIVCHQNQNICMDVLSTEIKVSSSTTVLNDSPIKKKKKH